MAGFRALRGVAIGRAAAIVRAELQRGRGLLQVLSGPPRLL